VHQLSVIFGGQRTGNLHCRTRVDTGVGVEKGGGGKRVDTGVGVEKGGREEDGHRAEC
jgi:hypothetical protein